MTRGPITLIFLTVMEICRFSYLVSFFLLNNVQALHFRRKIQAVLMFELKMQVGILGYFFVS